MQSAAGVNLTRIFALALALAAPACIGGGGGDDESSTGAYQIVVGNPSGNGLVIVGGPFQWSTTDGSPVDTACVTAEGQIADAGAGQVCVIGTHGAPGWIQCLPPPDIVSGSGADTLLCSICYAGEIGPGGESVAQCLANQQGVDCHHVIACTGSVEPIGNVGHCAQVHCNGEWVDGCTPPNPIVPSIPGICFTSPGPRPWEISNACRARYAGHVVERGTWSNTTCQDIWNDPAIGSGDWRFQLCQSLVRRCFLSTLAAQQGPQPVAIPAGN